MLFSTTVQCALCTGHMTQSSLWLYNASLFRSAYSDFVILRIRSYTTHIVQSS